MSSSAAARRWRSGPLRAVWSTTSSAPHGSKGTWDATADIAALAARRQLEQRDAARRLSGDRAGEVVFLEYVDGELASDLDARRRIAAEIRRLRPDVVLGHDPWKRYRLHPDHRHAGLLACDGVVAARDPHFFPELGLPHHRPTDLLLWEADRVNHVEDVVTSVEAKLDALGAHESQFESTMHAVDTEQLEAFRARQRDKLVQLGRPHGLAAAEVFARIADL